VPVPIAVLTSHVIPGKTTGKNDSVRSLRLWPARIPTCSKCGLDEQVLARAHHIRAGRVLHDPSATHACLCSKSASRCGLESPPNTLTNSSVAMARRTLLSARLGVYSPYTSSLVSSAEQRDKPFSRQLRVPAVVPSVQLKLLRCY